MNNRNPLVLLALSVVGLVCTASAQIQNAARPHYPEGNLSYLLEVTPLCQVVDVTPGGRKPANRAETRVSSIRVTRVDQIVRYQIQWTSGLATDVWQDNKSNLAVFEHAGSRNINVTKVGGGLPFLVVLADSALEWMGQGGQTEKATIKGKQCLHYRKKMSVSEGLAIECQAWMDEQTLLPVAMADADDLYFFCFDSTPPAVPLAMPASLKGRLERYQRIMAPPVHL
ncbi:MAG: hypothetical protein WCO68_10235 [Verrucomicrobiota bacterium]